MSRGLHIYPTGWKLSSPFVAGFEWMRLKERCADVRQIGMGASIAHGSVCANHPVAASSIPKHKINAFSLYFKLWREKDKNKTKRGRHFLWKECFKSAKFLSFNFCKKSLTRQQQTNERRRRRRRRYFGPRRTRIGFENKVVEAVEFRDSTASFRDHFLASKVSPFRCIRQWPRLSAVLPTYMPTSVTRLGDFLDFGQLFNAFGNN